MPLTALELGAHQAVDGQTPIFPPYLSLIRLTRKYVYVEMKISHLWSLFLRVFEYELQHNVAYLTIHTHTKCFNFM